MTSPNEERAMRGFFRRLDRRVESTPWMRYPKRRRVLFSLIGAIELAALMALLGLVENSPLGWLFVSCFWALGAVFLIGLAVSPVMTARVAIRALAGIVATGAVAYTIFVIVAVASR